MALSMFGVCASATDVKDYPDYDKITYTEAVGVLSGLGVLEGDEGGFRPTEGLNRAEAAKIAVYLLGLQDEVTDGPSFTDIVGEQAWAKSVIAVAESQGLVAGKGNGIYDPAGPLTGYEWEKMVLCALGYDAKREGMLGDTWQGGVQALAKKVNLLVGLKGYNASRAITREEAAKIAFNALFTETVEYFLSNNEYAIKWGGELGAQVFGLKDAKPTTDCWGRPSHAYLYGKPVADKVAYSWDDEPVAEFQVAKTYCDIVDAIGERDDVKLNVIKNGKAVAPVTLKATDTKTVFGAQGEQVEIYKAGFGPNAVYTAVVIDTYLAVVDKVVPAKADAKGHTITEAYTELHVYTLGNGKNVTVKGNDYAKDSYVLVNICEETAHNERDYQPGNAIQVTINSEKEIRPTAKVLGLADTVTDSQTKVWSTTKPIITKREIGGATYNQAEMYILDQAQFNKGKYVWFFDQFGNVIGSVEYRAPKTYAVLESMIYNASESAAKATVLYPDETTGTLNVGSIDQYIDTTKAEPTVYKTSGYNVTKEGTAGIFGAVSDAAAYNTGYLGYALYEVKDGAPGTVELNLDDSIKYINNATVHASDATIEAWNRDAGEIVYANDDTIFIVREEGAPGSYEYKFYDIDTLPTYAGESVEAYYVEERGWASIVYIKNAVVEAELGRYVFPDNEDSYKQITSMVDTWVVNLTVDGVKRDVLVTTPVKEILDANRNKLFDVEWDINYDGFYYGYIDEVRLINDATEGYYVNYALNIPDLSGNVLKVDGVSYRITGADIVGADALTPEVLKENGIWVVEGDIPGTVETIYVGERLDPDKSFTAVSDDSKVTKTDAGYDIEGAKGAAKANVTYTATNKNAELYVDSEDDWGYTVDVTYDHEDTDYVTVWAEDGTFKEYTINVTMPSLVEVTYRFDASDMKIKKITTTTIGGVSDGGVEADMEYTLVATVGRYPTTLAPYLAGGFCSEQDTVFFNATTKEFTECPTDDAHNPVNVVALQVCDAAACGLAQVMVYTQG